MRGVDLHQEGTNTEPRRCSARTAYLQEWAAVVLFVLLSGAHAVLLPDLVGPDEPAHLGYVEVLLDHRLPTIDTPNPVGSGFVVSDDVWVANHPPLFYVLAAPLVAAGAGGEGLRLISVAAGAVGIWLLGALAREVTADRRVQVGAVWLGALCPQLIGASAYGQSDGLVFAMSVAVLLVCVRALRGRPCATWITVAVVSGACLTKGLLLVAAPVAAVCCWPRRRASLAVLAGAAVSAGWWYARNLSLYGDPTGAARLFDKFHRTSLRSPAEVVAKPSWLAASWQDLWASAHPYVHLGSGTVRLGSPSGTIGSSIGLGLIVIIAVAFGRVGPGWLWAGWSIPILLAVAQFVAGGGTSHPRYLLPILPVVALLGADGLHRIHRWAIPMVVGIVFVADLLLLQESWRVAAAYG